jgi:hypothetical protein
VNSNEGSEPGEIKDPQPEFDELENLMQDEYKSNKNKINSKEFEKFEKYDAKAKQQKDDLHEANETIEED